MALTQRVASAAYRLGWLAVRRVPESWARWVFRQIADIRERRRQLGPLSRQADELRSRVDVLKSEMLGASSLTTAELRLLCRDEVGLIEQRTALVNRLRAALCEYYPAALDAFDDWTGEGPWRFVVAFPTPAELAAAGRRKWETFLHAHKLYRPQTADERLLPKGTAYITDLGLTGPTDSVIGVDPAIALQRFLTQMPNRFEPAKGPVALHGAVIRIDPETGRGLSIERVRVPLPA